MPQLPTINLPTPVTIAAVAAQTVQAAFVPQLSIQATPEANKPWPMQATIRGLNADGSNYIIDPSTGKFVDHVYSRDLRTDSATMPLVAQTMGAVLTVIPLLAVLDGIEKQIGTGLKTIAAKTVAVADTPAVTKLRSDKVTLTAAVAKWTAEQPGQFDAPTIAAHLAEETAALADTTTKLNAAIAAQTAAQADLAAAQTLVWATLLAAWRTAAAPLGVTDAHAIPPQLVGLTPPAGVTL